MAEQTALPSEPNEAGEKLCWSNGAEYAFDKKSVLAYAPQDSGVYALDHFGIQLFIGESVNIREALLRHYYRRDFQNDQGQPTGFNFELCTPETRVEKACSLVAQFQPVHQTELVPEKSWGFISDRGVEQPYSFDALFDDRGDALDGAMPGRTRKLLHERFFFVPRQVIALAATFVLSLAVVFYLGVLTGESLQRSPTPIFDKAQTEGSAAATLEQFAATANASELGGTLPAKKNLQSAESSSTTKVEPQVTPATEKAAIPPPPTQARSLASRPIQLVPAEPAGGKAAASAESGIPGQNGKPWSVQIGAGTAKQAIEDQIARLKSKGYESYVVEAARDGQTWYRARVGRFGSRAEAETLRQILEKQEGVRNSFTVSSDEVRPNHSTRTAIN